MREFKTINVKVSSKAVDMLSGNMKRIRQSHGIKLERGQVLSALLEGLDSSDWDRLLAPILDESKKISGVADIVKKSKLTEAEIAELIRRAEAECEGA